MMELDFSDPFILAAAREVDEWLPNTPKIAYVPGNVQVERQLYQPGSNRKRRVPESWVYLAQKDMYLLPNNETITSEDLAYLNGVW